MCVYVCVCTCAHVCVCWFWLLTQHNGTRVSRKDRLDQVSLWGYPDCINCRRNTCLLWVAPFPSKGPLYCMNRKVSWALEAPMSFLLALLNYKRHSLVCSHTRLEEIKNGVILKDRLTFSSKVKPMCAGTQQIYYCWYRLLELPSRFFLSVFFSLSDLVLCHRDMYYQVN